MYGLSNRHSPNLLFPNAYRRPFAPVWQMYPISNDFTAFNWDWFTDHAPSAFISTIETKHAVIGEHYILPNLEKEEDVVDAEFWANVFSNSVAEGDNPMEPVSDILYPIID